MATIESIAEVQRSVNSQLLARMLEFESQLKTSPSSNITMFRLSEEFSNFKQHVWNILSLLQQQVAEILKTVDMAETRYRRKFLLLSGVPEKQNEDLPAHVLSLCQDKLKLDSIKAVCLKSCQRLENASNNKCRPILIKFDEEETKLTIWRKKSLLKGTGFVLAEFLTKQKQSWFMSACKHLGIRNVWTQNGSIVIKLPSGNIKRIYSQDDLETILQQVPSAAVNSSKPSLPETELPKAESNRIKRVVTKKK